MKVPAGRTDDITIVVPTGRNLDEIVDYVLQATTRRETPTNMLRHRTTEFGLSQGDAELALDRTMRWGRSRCDRTARELSIKGKGPDSVVEFSAVSETT